MSYLQQIAVELPEDIFSEIEHLSKEEIDSFFRKVIENQIEKKKKHRHSFSNETRVSRDGPD
ncbi:hypothetical protein [Thalassobacillus sp. C254]|uniref:hypothetical protein n=1 Tax=Thalassobacillus sp. C254 TaxID=1225341 RepID=UPI0006CF2696|nr:hypothetical protein [Thalassobacillus sp. C254]